MYPKPQLAYLHNNTLPRGTPLNPLFGKNISHMVGLSKYMMEINIVGRGLNSDFIEEELRFQGFTFQLDTQATALEESLSTIRVP